MISEAEKNRVRKELELKKRNLQEVLDRHSKTIIQAPKNVEDRANFTTDLLVTESNHKATKEMLRAVTVALVKLDNGTWGKCECGNEISEDRRTAMCWASRCRPCQEKIGLHVR